MQSWSAIQLAVLKYLHLNNFHFSYSMLIKGFGREFCAEGFRIRTDFLHEVKDHSCMTSAQI